MMRLLARAAAARARNAARSALLRGVIVLALALLAPAVRAPAAIACAFDSLTTSQPLPTSGVVDYFRFAQSSPRWGAVAVRPQPGQDWDIAVYGSTAPDPGCVTNQLASSNGGTGALDFVIGDFHVTPLGTYQVAATRYSGLAGATVEWNSGDVSLASGAGTVHGHFSPSQLVRVYDATLAGGASVLLDFLPQPGSGLHLSVFRNTFGAPYVVPRSFRLLELTAADTWTAPESGDYALVVTNDNGTDASFTLGIGDPSCEVPATVPAGTPVALPLASERFAFEAPGPGWGGLALRTGADAWDVTVFDAPVGGAGPSCFATPLASATFAPGGVDFQLLDLGATRTGWYFANAHPAGASAAAAVALGQAGSMALNDDPRSFSMSAAEPAQLHTIPLVAGHEYHVAFTPGDPGLSLLVLRNPGAGPYAAQRAAAVLTVTGTTPFTPDASGTYALVVVNDGAVSAGYTLAIGDCAGAVTLASGVSAATTGRHAYARFTQAAATWAVVGARKAGADDANLTVGPDLTAGSWPQCLVATPIVASGVSPPRQDFVAGDFNTGGAGTYSMHAYDVGTTGSPTTFEWEGGAQALVPNDNALIQWHTTGADFVRAWDVQLTAGRTYRFTFLHPGSANLHLCLFRNPGAGPYWGGRDSALFEASGEQEFVAPATGVYGMVIVNDSGDDDYVFPSVGTCEPTIALAAGGTTDVTAALPSTFVSFTQPQPYWAALAVRSPSPSDQWEVSAWGSGFGGPPGICFADLLSAETLGGGVTTVLAGNFHTVTAGTYYGIVRRAAGAGTGRASFAPGTQVLPLNGPPISRLWHDTNLLELWDVSLDAGQTYTAVFDHDSGIDAHVVLFRPVVDEGWQGRLSAGADESGSFAIEAPVTGTYGLAVVNDGGAGTFSLALYAGTLATGPPSRPARDAFAALSPNPARGRIRLDYALRDGARVSFDVIDMAGRLVSRIEPGVRAAGQWQAAWEPRGADGRPLAPGVYLVRMRAGERTIGRRKLALLE
jgi:hypothetical protein